MKSVAVLFGGRGAEREISCLSACFVLSHFPAGYAPLPIGIDKEGDFYLLPHAGEITPVDFENDLEKKQVHPARDEGTAGFLAEDGFIPCDLVLPVLHGDYGEDGRTAGLFSSLGFRVVGADTLGGALCFDKVLTKRVAENLGIPVVPWVSVLPREAPAAVKEKIRKKFGARPFPLFVKPSGGGSSLGCAKVKSYRALETALAEGEKYGEMLVEHYVGAKTEIEVGYLGGELPLFSGAGEIVSAHGFYDYREKYEKNTARISSASLSPETEERIYRYAAALLSPLHIRDLCRFDFFLTDGETVYFNEVNTFPGMTDASLYPKLFSRMGISAEDLIARLLALADARRI